MLPLVFICESVFLGLQCCNLVGAEQFFLPNFSVFLRPPKKEPKKCSFFPPAPNLCPKARRKKNALNQPLCPRALGSWGHLNLAELWAAFFFWVSGGPCVGGTI
jgi:hypothetical protein